MRPQRSPRRRVVPAAASATLLAAAHLALATPACRRANGGARDAGAAAATQSTRGSAAPATSPDGGATAPAPRDALRASAWQALLLSGGGTPDENSVAHERNVLFVARTLAGLGVAPAAQRVLFADGDDPAPDVRYEEPDRAAFRLLYTLGLLATPGDASRTAVELLREHELPHVVARPAAADHATVARALTDDAARAAAAAAPAPPLLWYVTDHGAPAPDRVNNAIVLWGARNLSVRDAGALLDRQPPARRVVAVMAQCFSGAFAALVHERGDPRRPLAAHDRCGFFAAPADRPAAGCSPSTDETRYAEYTSEFFAALGGADRAGRAVPRGEVDLDGDGRVALDEAHLYAVRREESIDVPVSTSEEYARRTLRGELARLARDPRPIRELLAPARPALRRTAAALLASLGASDALTLRALARWSEALRGACRPGLCETEDDLELARRRAHAALRRAAVRLAFPLPARDADPQQVLAAAGVARVAALADDARAELDAVLALEESADRLRVAAETEEARVERVRRLVELAALEQALRARGGAAWDAFERMRACEHASIAPGS